MRDVFLGIVLSVVVYGLYQAYNTDNFNDDFIHNLRTGGGGGGKWIDLTHDFSEDTVYWPTSDRFELETQFAGTTPSGFYYSAKKYRASEHGGTHMDAPVHFAEGQIGASEVALARLMGPAVVVDVSSKCLADPDYEITEQDILEWESKYGQIPAGSIVLLYTGQSKYWPNPSKYLGTDQRGPEAIGHLHFPGLHGSGAQLLVDRRVGSVGIDTASIDRGQSTTYDSHRILLPAGIPNFENVGGNVAQLPPYGAAVIALPMKIREGSGGPLRIVAYAR